jgi:hypothetical protein
MQCQLSYKAFSIYIYYMLDYHHHINHAHVNIRYKLYVEDKLMDEISLLAEDKAFSSTQ